MERNNDHGEGYDVGRTWAGLVKRRCEESGHRTLENSLRERSPEQSTTYGRKTTPYWWIQSQRTKDCIQNQSREAADNVARRWECSCWVPDQPRDEDLNHQREPWMLQSQVTTNQYQKECRMERTDSITYWSNLMQGDSGYQNGKPYHWEAKIVLNPTNVTTSKWIHEWLLNNAGRSSPPNTTSPECTSGKLRSQD